MKPCAKIWFNGKIIGREKAKIHISSPGLQYGLGVFEGIRFTRAENGLVIFRLEDHLKRFFYSAGVLAMKFPYNQSKLIRAVKETIKANKTKAGYLRLWAGYGYGKLGLNVLGGPVETGIAVWGWDFGRKSKPLKLKVSKYRRLSPYSTDIKAKISGHYVNSALALLEAKKAGFDDALFLDERGRVAEATTANVFAVKNGVVYTPKKDYVLAGLTRDTVIKLLRDEGRRVKEKDISPDFFKKADEIFLTGTAAGIQGVIKIDKQKIGRGKIGPTARLAADLYNRLLRGESEKHENWLTFVS